MHTIALVSLAASISLFGASPTDGETQVTAAPLPEYESPFLNQTGWIGADGDYSVILDNDRLLWLFSDTFVGRVEGARRVDCAMINNSVAIQSISDPQRIEFVYGKRADGSPSSFVTPDDGRGYFWLFAGVHTRAGLYMFLKQIENTGAKTGFAFRGVSESLGHVCNPSDHPSKWKIAQRKVPFCAYREDGSRTFGSALLADGAYVYVYGLDSTRSAKGSNAMILARAPADRFGDFGHWRFLRGGTWVTDFANCDSLCSNMASEFSVSYLPAIRSYVAVYTQGGLFGRIVMRTALRPEGPWSEPVLIYDCPDKNWHEKTFSYAAKAHPELAKAPNELIITYATNSFEFSDLMDDARLYWPRFIRATVQAD